LAHNWNTPPVAAAGGASLEGSHRAALPTEAPMTAMRGCPAGGGDLPSPNSEYSAPTPV